MREDLELYYKLLKTAMVELINKDYADFVNLSTNLVSQYPIKTQIRSNIVKYDYTQLSGGCLYRGIKGL